VAALLAAPAAQAQLLNGVFQDHAVLQRERPIALWGKAAPKAELSIAMAGKQASARADKQGNWRAELPALPAGGPFELTVTTKTASRTVHDVLVGDVWLCSGQSNMEFAVKNSLNGAGEVAAANDPQMRLLSIAHDSTAEARTEFKTAVKWEPVTPQSVADFSAACYFMARDLRASQKVPFGLIDASWGGTAINPWRSPASLAADPLARGGMELLDVYRRDPARAGAAFGAGWAKWWHSRSHDAVGSEPWQANPPGDWQPVPKFDSWEGWGVPALTDYNGIVWYRTEINLTAAQAAQPATLTLGVADDLDMSFVNGVGVGTTNSWDEVRRYPIAPGTLHAGVNIIAVSVLDTYGPGGMRGSGEQRALTLGDGSIVPLPEAPGWRYRVTPGPNDAPHAPWEAIAGIAGIYNGMIAPLGDYGLRGVAWYQGETDANYPSGYAGRLASLMAGWRTQFANPKLPFLIVQLPGWGARNTEPMESGFASIRDEERRAVAADANAALAVTIDLGDVLNLHPLNKQDVGHRLARAATSLAYGGNASPSGPLAAKAVRATDGIHVSFTGVEGNLVSYNGAPLGFELCGLLTGSCAFATARIAGSEAIVASPAGAPLRVRFCWGDSPVCNLSDASGIPAAPFELAIE
jgi:sialate O-acetylesterase